MLDRLTDLDDLELDEQAALFLHSKNVKRAPSVNSNQPSQPKFLTINIKQNSNSDAESAANSYEDKGASKTRIFSEPLLSDKKGVVKTKPSVSTLQSRELSIERVDAPDRNMRGSLRNKKTPIGQQDGSGSINQKSRGKKKQQQSLSNNDRKSSALFPGNLGARMSAYISDVGDTSDEEFVYPKQRNQTRLTNQRSGYLCEKPDRKSPVDSPLFSPRTPLPSQSASPLVSDVEYFKSVECDRAGSSNQFYESGSSIESEGEDSYFSTRWKNAERGVKSLPSSPTHRSKRMIPKKDFSRRAQGYMSPSHQASKIQSDVEETLPLFWKMNPSEARRRRNSQQKRNSFIGMLPFVLLGIICYFIYAFSTIPLTSVTLTAVKNVLAAEKELVFDAHLKGENWNIWAVEISTVDVGIFATPIKRINSTESGIIRGNVDIGDSESNRIQENRGTRPAEYLGNLDHLDEPITFKRGYGISGTPNNVTAQIRLRNPGRVTDEAENKWYQILRHPYELTFRGVLKYKLLFKSYAIRICAIQGIDPTADETKYEPLIVCDRENWDPRDFPTYRNY